MCQIFFSIIFLSLWKREELTTPVFRIQMVSVSSITPKWIIMDLLFSHHPFSLINYRSFPILIHKVVCFSFQNFKIFYWEQCWYFYLLCFFRYSLKKYFQKADWVLYFLNPAVSEYAFFLPMCMDKFVWVYAHGHNVFYAQLCNIAPLFSSINLVDENYKDSSIFFPFRHIFYFSIQPYGISFVVIIQNFP